MKTYHKRRYNLNEELLATGGVTAVLSVDIPTFENNLAPLELPVLLGIAKCHKDDNYNRKLGRDIALKRVTSSIFSINGYDNEEITYVTTVQLNHRETITVSIIINKNTKKFKLEVDIPF